MTKIIRWVVLSPGELNIVYFNPTGELFRRKRGALAQLNYSLPGTWKRDGYRIAKVEIQEVK